MGLKSFTFSKSFAEVLSEERVQCTCDPALRHLPGSHLPGCEVSALYEWWTRTARERWDAVKDVPSTSPTHLQGPPVTDPA